MFVGRREESMLTLLLINDYLGGQDARVCLLDVEKKVCIRSAALHIGRVG